MRKLATVPRTLCGSEPFAGTDHIVSEVVIMPCRKVCGNSATAETRTPTARASESFLLRAMQMSGSASELSRSVDSTVED